MTIPRDDARMRALHRTAEAFRRGHGATWDALLEALTELERLRLPGALAPTAEPTRAAASGVACPQCLGLDRDRDYVCPVCRGTEIVSRAVAEAWHAHPLHER